MDHLKEALLRRKNGLDQHLKISIEVVEPDKEKKEEEKKGMAPEVKDAKSPVEPKLVAGKMEHEALRLEDPDAEIDLDQREDLEGAAHEDAEKIKELGLPDYYIAKKAMPEEPIGREAKSLHEKALMKMKKNPIIAKNTFGGKK